MISTRIPEGEAGPPPGPDRQGLPDGLFRWREWQLWLLAVVPVLYFFPALFLGKTLYFRDIYQLALPKKALLADLVLSGQFPFWDALLHGGQPFLANPVNQVFYPTNLLYLALGATTAFNLEITLHLAVAGMGTYVLTRCLGMRPSASLLAGVIYAYSGPMLSYVNHINRFYALALLPLLLVSWHLFWRARHPLWCTVAILVEVTIWLSGGAEFALLGGALVAAWSVVFPYPSTTWRQRILTLLVLQALILGAVAIQIVPAVPVIRDSARAEGMSFASFSAWSVHPSRLFELVIPGFFGHTDTLDETAYWGRDRVTEEFPYILSLYVGLLPLILAAAAVGGRSSGRFPRRLVLFLAAVTGIGVTMSLGRYLPGFRAAFELVPQFSVFRFPVKFLAAALLPIALLSAMAAHFIFDSGAASRRPSRILAVITGISGIVVAVAFAVLRYAPEATVRIQEILFGIHSPLIAEGLETAFGRTTLIVSLGFLVFLSRTLRVHPWQPAVIVGLVLVDLVWAGLPVNPTAPRSVFENELAAAAAILSFDEEGRVYSTPQPSDLVLFAPSNDPYHRYRWNLDVLNTYLPWLYGLPVVFHDDFDGLAASRIRSMTDLVTASGWQRRVPLLSAAAVRWIVSHERLDHPQLEPLFEIPNASNRRFFVYRNLGSAPMVGFVRTALLAGSPEESLRLMTEPGFDPRSEVVLDEPGTAGPPGPSAVDTSPAEAEDCQAAMSVHRRTNHWTVMIDTAVAGWVVFSESFNPGWRVSLDGETTAQLHANFAFSAVFVPAGTHVVDRRHVPKGFPAGLGISLLSVVALVFAVRRFAHG